MSEIKLEREVARWALVEPKAIAESSSAAVMFLVSDAKKDIATLADALAAKDAEIARLRDELESAASLLETLSDGKGDVPAVMMQVMANRNRAALKEQANA